MHRGALLSVRHPSVPHIFVVKQLFFFRKREVLKGVKFRGSYLVTKSLLHHFPIVSVLEFYDEALWDWYFKTILPTLASDVHKFNLYVLLM